MGVGGGEYEFLGREALAAIDGCEHFGMQSSGDGEEVGGGERQTVAAAIVEVKGAGVKAGPVTASDTACETVTAHGDAWRRGDLAGGGTRGEMPGPGGRRMQAIG